MRVDSVSIRDFRNIREAYLEPDPEMNIIFGENAQGKTNLIEAIWLFSGMKSFRGARDAELKNFESDFAKIKMTFEDAARVQSAELTVTERRRATLNGVPLPSPAGLLGKFGAVVFSPSFLSIIQSGPAERRRFMDAAICRLRPSYAPLLAEYGRLVRQRNSLLKDIYQETSLLEILDVIDDRLGDAGEKIVACRAEFLEQLAPFACGIYDGLSAGKEKLRVEYVRKYEQPGASLRETLRTNRRSDLINKTTSAGPHRDDLDVFINDVSAREFGSQGQQRSCALALKLGESSVIRSLTGEEPVTLLDDVMSELDTGRQDYILNHIKGRQVFITCCEPSSVIRLNVGKRISVAGGRIVECT